MRPEEYKPLIRRILLEFDFDKVRKHMKRANWKWTRNGDQHVPSFAELYQCAESLLTEAAEEESLVSSGGFIAYYIDQCLELSFSITQCGCGLGDLEDERSNCSGGTDND